MSNRLSQSKLDKVLAYVFEHNMEDVRTLLSQSGVVLPEKATDKEAQIAFLKALKDNPSFRKYVADYLTGMVLYMKEEHDFVAQPDMLNMNFINATGAEAAGAALGSATGSATTKTTTQTAQKSGILSSLGGVLTNQDNLNKIFNTGLDTLSSSLQNKANAASEQRALEAKQLDLQIAQANAISAQGAGSTKKGIGTWGWVAIIGGTIGLGVGVYFLVRKKQ